MNVKILYDGADLVYNKNNVKFTPCFVTEETVAILTLYFCQNYYFMRIFFFCHLFTMCVSGDSGSQRRASDSLRLLSQMIVSCLVGAVIQTCSTEKLVNAHNHRALSFLYASLSF